MTEQEHSVVSARIADIGSDYLDLFLIFLPSREQRTCFAGGNQEGR
jgi:hypothetical protein